MEYCVRPCVQSLVPSKPAQEKEGKRGGKTPSKEGLRFLLPGHLASGHCATGSCGFTWLGIWGHRAAVCFPDGLPSWIHSCLRKADKNKDNKMNFKELKDFLKELNIQVDDSYARKIFRVSWPRVAAGPQSRPGAGSEPGLSPCVPCAGSAGM